MKTVVVIDVGTHKAEEVGIIHYGPRLTISKFFRHLRYYRFNLRALIRDLWRLDKVTRELRAKFRFQYVLIEPVAHREILDFASHVDSAVYIRGVTSCYPPGPVELFIAKDSLGNSIIPSKPGLTETKVVTYNFEFTALYEFVVRNFAAQDGQVHFMVRINAEGVEGPIIEHLCGGDCSQKPSVLAGSIGDIKKCFGEEQYEKAVRLLREAGIPYIYFTSNPVTWFGALETILSTLDRACDG